jgi:exodeoxyribonuclease VII large subunit
MAEKITLTELQLIIKDSLYMAMPDFYWVIAEISEIKENFAGHCYLELVEKRPDEKDVKARVRAVIWSNRYRFLKSFFENSTGESLREGMKILVRTKVEYHELYGLSLLISDIDPSYTIGEMALKRQMVITRLEEEGVFSMNKELEFPVLPQRIAVISSVNAAGYRDFINHLKNNSFGYVFYPVLFETVMQGTETELSVIRSLDRIADYNGLFDVVVIIRGGGSQIDLSWFDSYSIAYYVTQFPVPVLTGIGHEKDLSVTDLVAFQPLKTPTAVADYLIERTAAAEARLKELSSEITDSSQSIIDDYRSQVDSFRSNLVPFARLLISDQKERISGWIISIIDIGRGYISKADILPENQKTRLISAVRSFSDIRKNSAERLRFDMMSFTLNKLEKIKIGTAGLENSLNILNPEKVLKRGYTITTLNGKILRSTSQIEPENIIDTQFSDGSAKSKIIKKSKDKSKRNMSPFEGGRGGVKI